MRYEQDPDLRAVYSDIGAFQRGRPGIRPEPQPALPDWAFVCISVGIWIGFPLLTFGLLVVFVHSMLTTVK
jgi:hypothetical protein